MRRGDAGGVVIPPTRVFQTVQIHHPAPVKPAEGWCREGFNCTLIPMLHDAIFARASRTHERRRQHRTPVDVELVIMWHHDPGETARHPILDTGAGGLRIATAMPLVDGMTGTALRLLPQGREVDRPVMVVWVSGSPAAGYEAGLRYF